MKETELPAGFVGMIKELFGDQEGGKICDALDSEETPVSVRVNPAKTHELRKDDGTAMTADTLFEGMKPIAWARDGYYLPSRPRFTQNPLLHGGAFYVQEASSMIHSLIVSRLGLEAGCVAVDLCAAPGGKTGAVAASLPEGSVIVANEFVAQRAQVLRENMAKSGLPDVIVTSSDVGHIGRAGSFADLMIADVPCSGEGMMRKEETARTQWSVRLQESCAALQREILDKALPALRPGGWLIYSTCTFNMLEDEDNVRWLMEHHGLENVAIDVEEAWGIRKSLSPDVKALRFIPPYTRGEGLFVALLRQPEDANEYAPGCEPVSRKEKAGKGGKRQTGSQPDRQMTDMVRGWIKSPEMTVADNGHGIINAASPAVRQIEERLRRAGVRILSCGVDVASVKGRDLIPSAPLALSTVIRRDAFPEVELSEEDALTYLRHEALRLPADTPKGYILLTRNNLPLGFVKNIGQRANNLYPAEWRIRH